MAITSVAPEVPPELRELIGRLPFSPRAPGEELARTAKVPELNLRKGQTTALGDDSIQKTLPALPFTGSMVGNAVVPIPLPSLEQYASLSAELAMAPERRAEIRRRYNVMNEAARRWAGADLCIGRYARPFGQLAPEGALSSAASLWMSEATRKR